jgi:hypothetical protein
VAMLSAMDMERIIEKKIHHRGTEKSKKIFAADERRWTQMIPKR